MNQRAFTLVEISIVLVVIALLLAGIIGGKVMVRQSALRSVISDAEQLKIGFESFKDRYRQWPGDFENAFRYWGAACASTAANCNGNGDNIYNTTATVAEIPMAFRHLVLAEMITGNFSGQYMTGCIASCPSTIQAMIPGTNAPSSKIVNAGYSVLSNANGFQVLTFASASSLLLGAVFNPEEARSMDLKIDDGFPSTGDFFGAHGMQPFDAGSPAYYTDCLTGTPSAYNVAVSLPRCYISFAMRN